MLEKLIEIRDQDPATWQSVFPAGRQGSSRRSFCSSGALFVIGEGFPPVGQQPAGVRLEFVAVGLMLLGLAVGWKFEGWATILILLGFAMFQAVEGRFLRPTAFHLPLVPAALFAFCWWMGREGVRRPESRLPFGLLACPLLVLSVTVGLLYIADGCPARELPDIWIPWLGLMLGVASLLFVMFWCACRAGDLVVRWGLGASLLVIGLFGTIAVFLVGGDRLAIVPITIQDLFCLVYFVLFVVLTRPLASICRRLNGGQPSRCGGVGDLVVLLWDHGRG